MQWEEKTFSLRDKDDNEKEFSVAHGKMIIHLQAENILDIIGDPFPEGCIYIITLYPVYEEN